VPKLHTIEFLQRYTFVVKFKARKENKVTYALSRRALLLVTMKHEIVGLEKL
jgi:hypothetical protein